MKYDLGPYIANHDNAARLLDWLFEGAQHTALNLEISVLPKEDPGFVDFEDESPLPAKGDCNTVCCIAGAAYLMSLDRFDDPHPPTNRPEPDWNKVQQKAFKFLGLPEKELSEDSVWPLFSYTRWWRPTGPALCQSPDSLLPPRRRQRGHRLV